MPAVFKKIGFQVITGDQATVQKIPQLSLKKPVSTKQCKQTRTVESTQLTGSQCRGNPVPSLRAYWDLTGTGLTGTNQNTSRKPSGVQASTYVPAPAELYPQTLCWKPCPKNLGFEVTSGGITDLKHLSWSKTSWGLCVAETQVPTQVAACCFAMSEDPRSLCIALPVCFQQEPSDSTRCDAGRAALM